MNRNDLLFQLSNYTTSYNEEKLFTSSFIDLIKKEPDCYNRSLLSGHITGSAWILNKSFSKALLVYHKKLDKWLQPGGHADGDEDMLRVANRELHEETGIQNIKLYNESIFDLDIHLIPPYKQIQAHYHYDIRFLFMADDTEALIANHETPDIMWWSLGDLSAHPDIDVSIKRMIKKSLKLAILSCQQ